MHKIELLKGIILLSREFDIRIIITVLCGMLKEHIK